MIEEKLMWIGIFVAAVFSVYVILRPAPMESFQAETQIVEGCEYLTNSGGLTHKGNCKNPIHVYATTNK